MQQIVFNKIKILFFLFTIQSFFFSTLSFSQNSLVGDGFGGREWYKPFNYEVGAYTAYTVCGVDSQLYGWGGNHHGELASLNLQVSSSTPVAIPGMNHVKFFTTGYLSGVIKSDNTAWVWGDSNNTNINTGIPPMPTQVLTNVKFIDGGTTHIVFVKFDGTVWGMGSNRFGELGTGSISSQPVRIPVQMVGITNAVRAITVNRSNYTNPPVSPTYDFTNGQTVILLSDGTIKTTGGGGNLQAPNSTSPVTLKGLTNIVDIKGNWMAALALNSVGDVYSFGTSLNNTGVLGIGGNSSTPVNAYIPPTKIVFPASAKPIVAISSNNDGYTVLALDASHKLYGWGNAYMGQLGDSIINEQYSPILVADSVIDINAGETFSYILKTDSTLWASGNSKWDYINYDYGSIWMNLSNIIRHSWTQINPTVAPMNLCAPVTYNLLPIRLVGFTCSSIGKTANLAWESAEEINLDRFELEYSIDGVRFEEIANIKSTGSNSKYYFNQNQNRSRAFYRLKMIDKDGKFRYSEIRSISFIASNTNEIAPNPASDAIYVYSKTNSVFKSIQITSMTGEVLKTSNNVITGQPIKISDLPSGNYIIRMINKDGQFDFKIFIKL